MSTLVGNPKDWFSHNTDHMFFQTNVEAAQEWESVFQQLRDDLKFASKTCCEKKLIAEETKHKYFMSGQYVSETKQNFN